ncbi:MAG: 50S ribosomal protein L25 [Vicinamibacteraceae bacterium]
MASATLEATTRDSRGKNEARRLRVAGKIPAVLYGGAGGAVPLSVDPKALSRILHSGSGVNSIISLDVQGQGVTQVLVKEFLLEPIKHTMLHADFYRLQMDKAITVKVTISLKGEAKGVKLQGGIVDFPNREVEVECLPGDIPEHLTIDVSDLMIGQGVRLKELAEGSKWTPVSDPDTLIVHVIAAKVEEVAAEVAAATPEPEVAKKGKPEDEKDAGKKDAGKDKK